MRPWLLGVFLFYRMLKEQGRPNKALEQAKATLARMYVAFAAQRQRWADSVAGDT